MPLDLSWLSRDKTAGLGRLCGGRSFQPSIDVIDLVLSQNYSMDESGLGRGTGSRRQRIELCGVRNLPVERNWPLRIMCMSSIPATVTATDRNDLNRSIGRATRLTAR
jgi:hypothetical protein